MRLTCSTVSEATANPINCGTTLINTGSTTMKKAPKKAPKTLPRPPMITINKILNDKPMSKRFASAAPFQKNTSIAPETPIT